MLQRGVNRRLVWRARLHWRLSRVRVVVVVCSLLVVTGWQTLEPFIAHHQHQRSLVLFDLYMYT